jgi:hypothetical protein
VSDDVEPDTAGAGGKPAGRKPSSRSLATLAADFERLRKEVQEQLAEAKQGAGGEDGGELGQQVERLREQYAELAEQVEELAEAVKTLAGEEDEESTVVGSWLTATPEQAEVMLRELRTWINTVLMQHGEVAEQMVSCWYKHPDLVETLLVVQALWGEAWLVPKTNARQRAEVLERDLPFLVAALKVVRNQCRGGHQPPPAPQRAYRMASEEELSTFAAAWSTGQYVDEPDPPASAATRPAPGQGSAGQPGYPPRPAGHPGGPYQAPGPYGPTT